MVSLPHDVMHDILSRLPVKTLTRFRCVSKSWRKIICDPYFLDLHHTRSRQNLCLFFVSYSYDWRGDEYYGQKWNLHFTSLNDKGVELYKFTAMEDEAVDLVLPACCGLVCFSTPERIYLCNPSTRELLPLPKGSFISFGFGYLPSTKVYKLVRLFNRDDTVKCEIFTFGNGGDDHANISFCTSSWLVLEENYPYKTEGHSIPAFVNETIYWKISGHVTMVNKKDFIVSFNTVSEKFQTVTHPTISSNTGNHVSKLMELRGMLGMVDSLATRAHSTMVIWMLKDEKSSIWEKEYIVDLIGFDHHFLMSLFPITMRDVEIILWSPCDGVYFYNTDNKNFRKVKLPKHAFKFGIYWESLVSLKSS